MSYWKGKKAYRWLVLVICMLLYATTTLTRWNYTSIASYLAADLHIGKPELGLIGSAFLYTYSIAQIPGGILTDYFGGRRVISISVALTGVFCFAFAVASTFTEILVARALMGLFAASVYGPITAIIARWFTIKERGFAASMNNGGGGMGEIITWTLLPLIAMLSTSGLFGLPGWRISCLVMAAIVLAIAAGGAIILRNDPEDMGLPSVQKAEETKMEKDKSYKTACRDALKDPALWGLAVIWSGFIVCTRYMLGWMPVYAAEYYMNVEKMPKEMAMIAGGVIASTYILGRFVGAPIMGWLSDYCVKKRGMPRSVLMAFGLIASGVVFCFLSTQYPSRLSLAIMCFSGGFFFNYYSLVAASAAEMWPIRTTGFVMGVLQTVGQLVGALSLSVSGYMAVKFAVAGGNFVTDFVGIWYQGIPVCAVAFLVSLYVIRQERKAVAKRLEQLASEGQA